MLEQELSKINIPDETDKKTKQKDNGKFLSLPWLGGKPRIFYFVFIWVSH
jgi:hypothetical protein